MTTATATSTATGTITTEEKIPNWRITGDWFDVCKCNIPCPCEFAQAPSYGDCDVVLAYHISKGDYGDTQLDGLSVLAIGYFKGNIWAGDTKATISIFFDEKANEEQKKALHMIFSGKAGGFMAEFAKLFEVRGTEYASIKFEVADDLSYWSAEIPGKVVAKSEALTGPTTPAGKRVQTLNPPGSEVGPGGVATWGKAVTNEVDALGFRWKWNNRSSKHIPFDLSGP
jgi:hypothetical protein